MSSFPLATSLFTITFISQIMLISVLYPRRLRGLEQVNGVSLKRYIVTNYTIALIGLLLLPVHLHWQASGLMTATLLAIAFFLFFQLTPLAFPSIRQLWSRLASIKTEPEATRSESYRSTKLFDAVGRVPVAIAALMASSYLLFAGITWGGEVDTTLLTMAVFTSTQLLFAGSIAWTLLSLKRAVPVELVQRYQTLQLIAPLFVFASIMLSVYYFGKEILAAFDEPLLRPTMMSVFLQLVAICVFETLYFRSIGLLLPTEVEDT